MPLRYADGRPVSVGDRVVRGAVAASRRVPRIGDRIGTEGATGTVVGLVCRDCRETRARGGTCDHTPHWFTIARDDGETGDGCIINAEPYNGSRGWIVEIDGRFPYSFLDDSPAIPTPESVPETTEIEFSPDMEVPDSNGPISCAFEVPSVGDFAYHRDHGWGKVFSVDGDKSFTVYFPKSPGGAGDSIPFPPHNGRNGYIVKAKQCSCHKGEWDCCLAIVPANPKISLPLRAVKVEEETGSVAIDKQAVLLRRKLKEAKLAGAVGRAEPSLLKKGKVKPSEVVRYRVSLRAHSSVSVLVSKSSNRKELLIRVKRAIVNLRAKLRREKGRDEWAAFAKQTPEKVLTRLSKALEKYREEEIRKNKSPKDGARYVGVEIECLIPDCGRDKLTKAFAAARLHKHVSIHDDGSVSGPGQSHEVVVMDREESIKETVTKVCTVLASLKATTNRTCGLHVHLDMRNKTEEERKLIYGKLVRAHTGLYSMLPASRKANHYCRPNTSPSDPNEEDRYYAVNWTALRKHGTIEVRSHSGTVDPVKINNWVELLIAARDASVRLRAPSTLKECLKWLKVRPEIEDYALAREEFFKTQAAAGTAAVTEG